MPPRRYQLRKQAVSVVERGHPWVFRDQLSSAASVFRDGDWLRLVDGANRVIGHGIYEASGAIAIRVLRRGRDVPDAAWLRGQLVTALARRSTLASETNAIRLINGESDGLPATVVDRFGDTLVGQSYSRGADALTRFSAIALARELAIPNVLLRPAVRRRSEPAAMRVLCGAPPTIGRFIEGGVTFHVDLASGQKSGTYLDLRGLRRWVASQSLAGKRVLNLFSYSGMLGRMAELAGASAITQVDASERALAFAAEHHVADRARHTFICADIFEWLPALDSTELFDLVIVDPPAMTSDKSAVPRVLAAYRKLYRAAAPHVAPGGALVAACCTSRIDRAVFERTLRDTLGDQLTREGSIAPEPDHPAAFREADYLKIICWRR
ncbi:MAG: class I SAM-dependent rRNA methyltransferase [Kofleriaceae bacterium]